MAVPITTSESDSAQQLRAASPSTRPCGCRWLSPWWLPIALGYFSPGARHRHEAAGRCLHPHDHHDHHVLIFCTVVTGIAGMQDMKKVGRVGGKALLYFEVVSTVALAIGLIVGNVVQSGQRLQCESRHAGCESGRRLCRAGQSAKRHRIPDAHHSDHGDRMPSPKATFSRLCLLSILFGFALSSAGPRAKPMVDLLGIADSSGLPGGEHPDALCADRRFRRHGIHNRQIWVGLARAAGQADRHFLGDFHSVCADRAWRDMLGGGIQHRRSFCCTSRKRFCWFWPPVRRRQRSPH